VGNAQKNTLKLTDKATTGQGEELNDKYTQMAQYLAKPSSLLLVA